MRRGMAVSQPSRAAFAHFPGLYKISINRPCTSAAVNGDDTYLNSTACLSVRSRPLTSASCSDSFG